MNSDLMFVGLVEYGRWLKDSIYGTRNDVIHLKETDFIG